MLGLRLVSVAVYNIVLSKTNTKYNISVVSWRHHLYTNNREHSTTDPGWQHMAGQYNKYEGSCVVIECVLTLQERPVVRFIQITKTHSIKVLREFMGKCK